MAEPTSVYDFYRTQSGKNFFGLHFPSFINQLERIAEALEVQNKLKEKELKESKKIWLKEQADKKKYFKNYQELNEEGND